MIAVDTSVVVAAFATWHEPSAMATRNVRHFRGLGLKLVDPWAA